MMYGSPEYRARMRAERDTRLAKLHPAPPTMPRERVHVDAAWVPQGARTAYRQALKAGWTVQLTRAVGPRIGADGKVPEGDESVCTIALAAQAPDGVQRLVWVWRWRPEREAYTATTGRQFAARKASWQLDDVCDGRTGRIMTNDGAKGLL